MKEEIESALKENRVIEPSADFCKQAQIGSMERYQELYQESIQDPEGFWGRQAETELTWFRKWDQVLSWNFDDIGTKEAPYVEFFKGGTLNASVNCLDRHIEAGRADKPAILWQGEEDGDRQTLTYGDLHRDVCRFANVLKKRGVGKGTVVTVYMPMIPELPVAILACARIGAIHSVVFSAFSSDALKNRIQDCKSEVVLTADDGVHAGKANPLKSKVDEAVADCPTIKTVSRAISTSFQASSIV